jgi:2-dehydropantoate 2-reductase
MGAGSLGCFFGARLALAGASVTLIGRTNVDAIASNGLVFESGGATQTVRLNAATDPGAARGARLVLVCVKSADTGSAAAALAPHLDPDTVLVSLQNGVGNVERIRAGTGRPVVAGLVYIGANMPAPGHVRHAGGERIVIGAVKDCGVDGALLAEVAAVFRAAGLTVDIAPDLEPVLWEKLMLNCAYNAVCALTGKPYGAMGAVPDVRAVMQQAADEVVALARRKGVTIRRAAIESLFIMTQSMPQQMSSTAQDIARGRPTEINYLNGYVARESEALGLAAPVNRTLNALVKLRETP